MKDCFASVAFVGVPRLSVESALLLPLPRMLGFCLTISAHQPQSPALAFPPAAPQPNANRRLHGGPP
jgi:hypothetical protein